MSTASRASYRSASSCRRTGSRSARTAAGDSRPADAGDPGPRGRPAGRTPCRRRAARATGRHRAVGVPDRPGGADERAQARRRGARFRARALRPRLARARDRGRRCRRLGARDGRRARSRRHARARRALRRPLRRRAASDRRLRRSRAATDPMTSVLIADDQALVRVGLRKILESEPETSVVGEAGDGEDAVALARELRPDVVLMDIRMPVLDGIEATRRIVRAQPGTRVLILTTFGLDGYVYDALRAGASGFMLKDAPPEEIVAAVRIVASGEALLAPAVTRAVIEEFARRAPAAAAPPPAV